MSRPLAAASFLLSIASTAAWAGPATDFCNAMRQGYADCHAEAMRAGADGQPVGECLDVKNKMIALVPTLSADATSEVRTQMPMSYQVWLSLANAIAHSGGMSAAQLDDIKRRHQAQLNSECYKLQMMDY